MEIKIITFVIECVKSIVELRISLSNFLDHQMYWLFQQLIGRGT